MKKLRSLIKKIIPNCNHCKLFSVKTLLAPIKPLLPEFRAKLTDPFTYTGVDFAGQILYQKHKNTPKKSYIALFTCSATRAVHLKLCRDPSAEDFVVKRKHCNLGHSYPIAFFPSHPFIHIHPQISPVIYSHFQDYTNKHLLRHTICHLLCLLLFISTSHLTSPSANLLT